MSESFFLSLDKIIMASAITKNFIEDVFGVHFNCAPRMFLVFS